MRRLREPRDCIQISQGDDRGFVLLLTPEAVETRLPTVDWPHPHTPVRSSRLISRVMLDDADADVILELVEELKQQRAEQFRDCDYCGRRTPPERAHSIDGKYACHGCSEREMGIVH